MVGGNGPRFWKSKHDVAWIFGRGLERPGMTVPIGLRVGKIEPAPERQAKFERRQRTVAGIAKVVDGIDVNSRLRVSDEMHPNFLLLDGVPGAERRGACGSVKSRGEGGQKAGKTVTIDRRQSASDCSE